MTALYFIEFSKALSFLKAIKTGKIVANVDGSGYVWESDGAQLSREQLELCSEANGSNHIWYDNRSTLTWLLKDCGFHASEANFEKLGGFSDWRTPTLWELKTLSADTPNEFGAYVIDALKGRVSGNFHSSTTYHHWTENAWWSFDENCATTEDYRDSEVKWGSEGDYAGFEGGGSRNSATRILVRGVNALPLQEWAVKLIDWAEEQKEFNFPVVQSSIDSIESLYLSHADSLPPELALLPSLKKLKCKLPSSNASVLFSLKNLTELELDGSRCESSLEALPQELQGLQNLVRLKVTHVGLRSIDSALGSLSRLEFLDLTGNKISSIPSSIESCVLLQNIRLHGNPLADLPSSIGGLKDLRSLNIMHSSLMCVPESIGNLSKLEQLNIGGGFTELPESLSALVSLNSFWCNAPLEAFPSFLPRLKNLRSLRIESTCTNFDFGLLNQLTMLTELDLSNTKLEELPPSLILLERLETLVLSGTSLASLPDWILEMKSLKTIKSFERLSYSRPVYERFFEPHWAKKRRRS